jgi:hypothetical protein
MKKRPAIKHDDLYIGQLVVVTEHYEAQVYTVAGIKNHMAILQWYEGKQFCSQGHEKYGLLKPDLKQIEYSVAANGPLVSTRDILEWA